MADVIGSLRRDPLTIAIFVTLVAATTISGAWAFEWFGYAPCELCLQQRYAYLENAGLGGVVYIMDNDKEGESKGKACLAAATAAG